MNLRQAKKIVILGGGTAGWFAALTLRRVFSPKVEIRVIESSKIGIVGVGEGGLLNLMDALQRNNIPLDDFIKETGAAYKWGFCYEGWRDGSAADKYYHLFATTGNKATDWSERGFFPYFSAMINQGIPLHQYIRGFKEIEKNASQQEAKQLLESGEADLRTSLHFDSHRVATYLKKVALSRGVVHQDAIVDEVLRNELGHVHQLQTNSGPVNDIDFLIDATGLARKVVGKTLGGRWQSFKDYLLMDSAIPFHMPHPYKEPFLLTRAIAMNAGWMWQIPLIERVGAGYVFSSKHITEEQALAELKARLGFEVQAHKTIRFDPGCFEEVWQGNVMALGLASGFVEPLEATSIGQMLEQLRNFERVLLHSHGVVSKNAIADFNQANVKSWLEVRDFLRMHYDCPRRDTKFWQDVAQSAMPDTYRNMKECFTERTPRMIDIENYAINGWSSIFHVINWIFVATPLGLIPPQAAGLELLGLSKEKQADALKFVEEVRALLPK